MQVSKSSNSGRTVVMVLLALLLVGSAVGLGVILGQGGGGSAPQVTSVADLPQDTSAGVTSEPVIDAVLANDELAARYGESVLRVEAEGCQVEASGTAWVLDDKHLVTNWHVVSIDPTPELVSRDGTATYSGTVIGGSMDPDVAVIRVDEELPPPLSWAATDGLREGQEIVSLGYPAPAGDFAVTPSTILSFQSSGETREAIRGDGAIDRGNSGGPALTKSGEVAGVATLMVQESNQLQMLPIIFTADSLSDAVEAMIAEPEDVEPDCDRDFAPLPDEWAEDYGDWNSAGPQSYGDDDTLDRLYDACSDGDMAACDDLWWSSPTGSEYEAHAATCGGTTTGPSFGTCELETEWASQDAEQEAEEQRQAEASAAALSTLVGACEQGDMQACDDLQWEADWGSSEYDLAESCGGHYPEGWGSCVDRKAEAASLQSLADACTGGDMQACDDLQWEAEWGSSEYDLAETCGGHYPEGWGSCVDRQEDAAEVEVLVGKCGAGDMDACDELYWMAPDGSSARDVAEDCGGRYPGEGGSCAFRESNP